MDYRAKKYYRKQFQIWKAKVRAHLPTLAIKFYEAKLNGVKIDERTERQLGRVINDINSYEYSLGIDSTSEIGLRVLLEIDVTELFEFVNKKLPTLNTI